MNNPEADLARRFLPDPLPDDPRELEQLRREFANKVTAFHKTLIDWEKALSDGDPGRMKPTRRLSHHWAALMVESIEAEADKKRHVRGTRPHWISAYQLIGAEALSLLTIETILATLANRMVAADIEPITSTRLADEIGLEVEWAARMALWEKHAPGLLRSYRTRLKEAGATVRHSKEVLRIGLNKKARNPERASQEFMEATEGWPRSERVQLGRWLLLVAEQVSGGGIKLERRRKKNGRSISGAYYVKLSDETWKYLEECIQRAAIGASLDRAMVCPPVEWRGLRGGGYLINKQRQAHIICADRPYIRQVLDAAFRNEEVRRGAQNVLDALNAMQRVPFAINERVHDVASEGIASRLDLSELPESQLDEVPPKPLDENDQEAMATWRGIAAEAHRKNESRRYRALVTLNVIAEASDLRSLYIEDRASPSNGPLYFPHRLDFRGRCYAAGTGVNPQAGDLSRSLLRFHNGKPIGDGAGPQWLKRQVAKAFGQDKLSWAEREQWTHDNEELLRRIAEASLERRREWEADDPEKVWSKLAAADEWTRYAQSGHSPEFITHLPCYIDGTCNGLQHFAALAGDSKLAALVNVMPSTADSRPCDVYQATADRLLELVIDAADNAGGDERRKAHLWLRVLGRENAPRSLAKRVVMVTPYGGSHKTALDEIRAYLDNRDPKRLEWGGDVPTQADENALVGGLSTKLKRALGDRVDAADKVMTWLKTACQLLCEYGVADKLQWCTPIGWPWSNVYRPHRIINRKVSFGGHRTEVAISEDDLTKFDKKAARDGVSPNFVQSLDASALMFAVLEAQARSVRDITCIHDSVGFLAPDGDTIAECVRLGYGRTHEALPLLTFREAVLRALPHGEARRRLPMLPQRGDLDVKGVLSSAYFFC